MLPTSLHTSTTNNTKRQKRIQPTEAATAKRPIPKINLTIASSKETSSTMLNKGLIKLQLLDCCCPRLVVLIVCASIILWPDSESVSKYSKVATQLVF